MEHRQQIGSRQHDGNKRRMGIANQVSEGKTSVVSFSMLTGFFAGVIWGCVRWLSHYMHFTRVEPGFLAEPFFATPLLSAVLDRLRAYCSSSPSRCWPLSCMH